MTPENPKARLAADWHVFPQGGLEPEEWYKQEVKSFNEADPNGKEPTKPKTNTDLII